MSDVIDFDAARKHHSIPEGLTEEEFNTILKWDTHWLTMAKTSALASKDPSTQVGCVIVGMDNRLIGHGYNGFPFSMEDKEEWLEDRTEKYDRTIHAEVNAILSVRERSELDGATMYVYPFQACKACAPIIAQVGIIRVVSPIAEPERWSENFARARELLSEGGVIVTRYMESADA